MAYFELNIDYIIETYCENKAEPKLQCNGQCHLAKQLITTPVTDSSDKTSIVNTLYETFLPVYYQDYKTGFSTLADINLAQNIWHYSNTYSNTFNSNLVPPPKVV